MAEHRQQLREARARHQHREATCGPLPPLTDSELARLTDTSETAVIEPARDGLATWRYTVLAGGTVTGPAPAAGGGQFWLISAGAAAVEGSAFLPPQSCVFVPPDGPSARLIAGPSGADLLCLQFPRQARD